MFAPFCGLASGRPSQILMVRLGAGAIVISRSPLTPGQAEGVGGVRQASAPRGVGPCAINHPSFYTLTVHITTNNRDMPFAVPVNQPEALTKFSSELFGWTFQTDASALPAA